LSATSNQVFAQQPDDVALLGTQFMNNKAPLFLFITACLSVLSVSSCNKNTPDPVIRQSTAMDTFLTATIYDPGENPRAANAWVDSAFQEIARIEQMATDYDTTSQIGRINAGAGIESVAVSDELIALLRRALHFGEISNHAFDAAVEPIVKAWDFLSAQPHTPSEATIKALLPLINSGLISIKGNKVYLPKRGMGIDLGGIAKGYAVDRSVEVLKRGGFKQFIVDLGGNLGVYWNGTRMLDSTVAEILIRHPRKDGEFFGKFMTGTGGISTSGDYQRFFVENGIRYHHIIDPSTGYPARGMVSATILAADATSADAISTLVFVLGREKGMAFIRNAPGVEGLIIYQSGDTLAYEATARIQSQFKLFESGD